MENTLVDSLTSIFTGERALAVLRAIVLLAAGFLVASIISRLPQRIMGKRLTAHQAMLSRRLIYYLVLALFIASALRELGFSLGVLLGAAGILSVAIGFASQTSASNLISGLFLIGERSFEIGDEIAVGSISGEVLSIDALSVKLRTYDNLYVRIPNETLIKSEVTTLTRFSIRRLDMLLGIAWKSDINQVGDLLLSVADNNPLCLDRPAPQFTFLRFGEAALEIQFSVWALRTDFTPLRNSLGAEIKAAFEAAGIEIPLPARSLSVLLADSPGSPTADDES